jgi:hypothetical protein
MFDDAIFLRLHQEFHMHLDQIADFGLYKQLVLAVYQPLSQIEDPVCDQLEVMLDLTSAK